LVEIEVFVRGSKEWLADPDGQARAHTRFAPLFAQIQSAQTESEVADILKSLSETFRRRLAG